VTPQKVQAPTGVQAKAAAVDKLTALAAEAGVTLAHPAVAFVRSHPAVTSVLIGPRRPEHCVDLLAGVEVELDDDLLGIHEPLRGQLRIALNSGVTPEQIVEAFIHLAAYVGVARAFDSYAIAAQVFAERADVDGAG
jgi:hypothetical protein